MTLVCNIYYNKTTLLSDTRAQNLCVVLTKNISTISGEFLLGDRVVLMFDLVRDLARGYSHTVIQFI